jgi:hypothetical protein
MSSFQYKSVYVSSSPGNNNIVVEMYLLRVKPCMMLEHIYGRWTGSPAEFHQKNKNKCTYLPFQNEVYFCSKSNSLILTKCVKST